MMIVKGMKDILGVKAIVKESLITGCSLVARQYGYTPMTTPHIEYESTLGSKLGKEMYTFTDNGGRELGLRFDHTTPLSRIPLDNTHKRYTCGSVFRGEKPRVGRYREFTQFDVDIIGTYNPYADAEVIHIADTMLTTSGIDDYTIQVSNILILKGFIDSLGLNTDETTKVLRVIDKLHKVGEVKTLEDLEMLVGTNATNVMSLIKVKVGSGDLVNALKQYNVNKTIDQGITELQEVTAMLNIMGTTCKIDLSLARGFDYYTGTIFETTLDTDSLNIGSVCSGGRYIIPNVSGVGMSIGVDRVLAFYNFDSSLHTADVMVTHFGTPTVNTFKLMKFIRDNKLNVLLYPEPDSLSTQLNYANNNNIPYVIILGDESHTDAIIVKHMKTGKQKSTNDYNTVLSILKE